MNKRASLILVFAPALLLGLMLLMSQTVAVSGDGLGDHTLSMPEVPLVQGPWGDDNDTIETADPITRNVTVFGRIPFTPTGDIDFYRLIVPSEDIPRDFRASLQESPPSGDYQLMLSLFDAEEDFIDSDNTGGGDAYLDWTSSQPNPLEPSPVVTYYLKVEGVPGAVDEDAPYEITVIRFDAPAPTEPWDDCEINDNRDGSWPGGPCPLSIGVKHEDLNFVPYTDQPTPNDDYFTFLAKDGHTYRITTIVAPGANTTMTLYDPQNNFLVTDYDGGENGGSRIELTLSEGWHKILVINGWDDPPPDEETLKSQTYDILVEDITPGPTDTPLPGTVTATPTRVIRGQPDAFEPNYDFDRATLIGLATKYTNLNFVPWTGVGQDNDFYKLWVVAGKLYTCETSELGEATNTNMIICSGPSWEQCFAGNDDVQPFDPNDPYRSRLTFFSSYNGYLYLVLGQVGADRILPEEWARLSYSLECYIDQPGTATPTPTGRAAAPPPQPTSTPVSVVTPDQATPVPSPTPRQLVVLPKTTPRPPSLPTPAATPTPELYVIEMLLYYDRNDNGQMDGAEGIKDMLARAYDAISGDLLSIDYTDEAGYLRFTVPGKGPVRVSVPFLGFNQIVTATNTSIQIRVSPRP